MKGEKRTKIKKQKTTLENPNQIKYEPLRYIWKVISYSNLIQDLKMDLDLFYFAMQ